MNKTFNLYCDESCHLENDQHAYMLISYVGVAYNQVKLHSEFIRNLKKKHHFFGEIKWSNVSHSQIDFYLELIEYFFATDLHFRSVIVKKDRIKNDAYGQDFNTFYYKMYYQLIYHKINMNYAYNVYLDIKDTLSANKVEQLKDMLRLEYSSIRNVQNIRSHESDLMQLADVLMGALSYHLNNADKKVIAKNQLIEKIKGRTELNLKESTAKDHHKFNLFFIDLK